VFCPTAINNTYDAGGIRQSQNIDGIETRFLVDPNRSYHQVLEELDDSNTVEVTYVYGDDLLSQNRAGAITTYGYDGLGSTRILTNTSGAVETSYGYQAFGELDYQIGTTENSYLFTGEQYDNNVGFYYLRARFYNPQIGRFSQMDTFAGMQFEPKSLHKYLYTHADPINNIDPSGKFGVSLTGTIQAVGILASLGTSAYAGYEGYEFGSILYRVHAGASLISDANLKSMAGIATSIIPLSWLTKVTHLAKVSKEFVKLGFAVKIYDKKADANKVFHFVAQLFKRGITPKEALDALKTGKKYFDTKTGAVAHVLGENTKGTVKVIVDDNVIKTAYRKAKLGLKFKEL